MDERPQAKGSRALKVILSIAMAVATLGFFTGTRGSPSAHGYRPDTAQPAHLTQMPKQRDMELQRYAQRNEQQQSALAQLEMPPRELSASFHPNEKARAQEIAERARGRAYDGAPPTIPHPVEQTGAPACLSCHERGLSVEGKIAIPISHTTYTSCQQCHATRESPLPATLLKASVSERNTFQGLPSPGRGPRAWTGAPPQMPHRSFMRERCASCHGVWANGLASSHPYRQNCSQCHTPSAESDQRPTSPLLDLPPLEASP